MAKKLFASLGKAACYTLLFIGMQLIVSMIFALVAGVSAAIPYIADNSTLDMDAIMRMMTEALYKEALTITLISSVCSLAFLALFFAVRKKNVFAQTYLAKGLPNLAFLPLVLGGMCLAGFVGILLDMLPIPEHILEEYSQSAQMLGGAGWVAVLSSVVVAPIAEEVIFRGLVYTRLRRAMPPIVAMLLSSAVFGLLHGQLLWVCYAFFVGLVMAFVFERTGTVQATILLHFAFNLAGSYLLGSVPSSPILAFAFAAGATACWVWLCRICPYTKLRPEGGCD